jgi:hypothetical protein
MEIKVELVSKVHPKIWTVDCDEFCGNIQIVHSPFGNCQTFSLMQAKQLIHLSDSELSLFLEKVCRVTDKTQMVIDLQAGMSKEIFPKLEPLCKHIQKIVYTSTNGSSMVLCLVKINLDKCIEINDRET